MTLQTVDQQKVETFGQRMVEMLNCGALTMMLSIGHRTGLFDALADGGPATSEALAERTGLHERYVREWLGAMVTGGIVEYDPATGQHALPAEHAAWLTRPASPNNVAATMQWISVLGTVEDEIVEVFRRGGGVPYSSYRRFHEVMAEESAQTTLAGLLDRIVPLVPGLAERLERGVDVLDVGCGAGRAMNLLARTFPKSRFRGYDLSPAAIAAAEREAAEHGTPNVHFRAVDVAQLAEREQYDLVTAFDAIHDQARPDRVLAAIHRALRPGGTFLMQDIATHTHVHENGDQPLAPFIYTISCMHCMTVSLAGGGMGLGAAWGREKALEMLAASGFADVRVEQLEHDPLNYYYIATKA